MMIIRVLGSGLIPRGLGLAPRMTPTKASLNTIQTIMSTNGLTVEFCKPDGTWIKLTRENLTGMWAVYGSDDVPVKTAQTTTNVSKPVTPEPKFATAAPAETNVVNEKTEAPVTKADDKSTDIKNEPVVESKDKKTDEKKGNESNNLKVVNNPNDKKHN